MGDVVTVQELDSLYDLVVKEGSFFLFQAPLLHNVIEELSAFCVLHDHVDCLIILNDIVQLDDIAVLDFLQNFDFTTYTPTI